MPEKSDKELAVELSEIIQVNFNRQGKSNLTPSCIALVTNNVHLFVFFFFSADPARGCPRSLLIYLFKSVNGNGITILLVIAFFDDSDLVNVLNFLITHFN
jgi:hypothetical protein